MLNNFQAGCRSGQSPFDLLAEAHNKIPVVDLHYEQAWNGLAEAERQEIYREHWQLIQELQSKETTKTFVNLPIKDLNQD